MGNIINKNTNKHHFNQIQDMVIKQQNLIEKQTIIIENIQNERENLNIEIETLKEYLNEDTKQRLYRMNNNNKELFSDNIDNFVENWYSENDKEIDIGVIADLPIIGEIDVLPDKIEKYIYKNILHIMFSALRELDVNVMGTNVSLTLNPSINNKK